MAECVCACVVCFARSVLSPCASGVTGSPMAGSDMSAPEWQEAESLPFCCTASDGMDGFPSLPLSPLDEWSPFTPLLSGKGSRKWAPSWADAAVTVAPLSLTHTATAQVQSLTKAAPSRPAVGRCGVKRERECVCAALCDAASGGSDRGGEGVVPGPVGECVSVSVPVGGKAPLPTPIARRALGQHAVRTLRQWLLSPQHVDYPYPTEEEKLALAAAAGITVKQLTVWFTNARKRVWAPLRKEQVGKRNCVSVCVCLFSARTNSVVALWAAVFALARVGCCVRPSLCPRVPSRL